MEGDLCRGILSNTKIINYTRVVSKECKMGNNIANTFGSIPIKNLVDVLDIFIIDMYLYACIGMYILP